MSRLTTALTGVLIAALLGSGQATGDSAEGFDLLMRRNPSLRTGIVSVVRLTTGTGVLRDPPLETRRRLLFDRDKGLLRIDQTRIHLDSQADGGEPAQDRDARIRTPDMGIIFRPHRRTIDVLRSERLSPQFDPFSVGLLQESAMDNHRGFSDYIDTLREADSEGRLAVSTFDAGQNERAVSFQIAYPESSIVAESIYWFATDQGNVPFRFIGRTLKQLDEGRLEPKGPLEVDCSVHWAQVKGAFVPQKQTITERVLNAEGEVIGVRDFALSFEWEMVNEDFDDLSVFSVESLDVPKGSNKIVDSRSGQPVVIQDPRIPSAAMLARLNQEVRNRSAAVPARTFDDHRSDIQPWLIVGNLIVLSSIAIVFVIRRVRLRCNSKS